MKEKEVKINGGKMSKDGILKLLNNTPGDVKIETKNGTIIKFGFDETIAFVDFHGNITHKFKLPDGTDKIETIRTME